MATGIDFHSAGSISAVSIKAQGYDFVANYLGEGLTSTLAGEYQSAGLAVVSLYQTYIDHYIGGVFDPNSVVSYDPNIDRSGYLGNIITYWDGYYQARIANNYAVEAMQDSGSAIYFAIDADILPSDVGGVLDYFRGINDGLSAVHSSYMVGIYGDHDALDAVIGEHLATYKWLAYGWRYDGTTSFDISQISNDSFLDGFPIAVDHNITSDGTYGQWVVVVPEPTSLFLLAAALLGFAAVRRARNRCRTVARRQLVGLWSRRYPQPGLGALTATPQRPRQ